MAVPPVVARLIADASGYVEGMSKSVAATRDWQLEMDKADLASRKMAVSAEASSQKAAAAQVKLTTASTEAAAAQREMVAAQEQVAAGQITAAEGAERQAAAEVQLAAANERAAGASIQLERASIAQAEAQTRAAAAARTASATTSTSATTAAATATRANTTAATASAGAWSRYGGIAKLAVGVIGYESIKSAGEFQKATNVYVTAAGETTAGLKKVRAGILDIAAGTGTPIKQLTDGMYLVEKAGYRGADALQVEKAAAQGAKEENASLATVTNAVTSVMASYHLGAGDAVMVTNELKAAAGESKTTMEQFSGSLSTVIPLASQVGISFADVGGALATMTQHGTTADEAAQELQNTIRNLTGGNAVASKEMAQLGISSADVSAQLGQKGLGGTIDYIVTTIGQKMGPSGRIMLDTFNQSKQAAANARTEFDALSPAAQNLATQFEQNKISAYDFRKATHDLGGEMSVNAMAWLQTYTNANGFQQALKNGTPTARSYAQELQKVFGGVNGMNTALMLGQENMAGYAERTRRIADAAKDAGTDVQGWQSTQNLFNTQMDRFKETVGVLGIKLGTDLLPAVTGVAHAFLSGVGFIEDHDRLFKALAISVGAVVIPMYAAAKAVKAYEAAVRGVAAVQAIWAGAVALYGRVATSIGWVTGASVEMEATQASVAAEVEATALALGGEATAAGEAATSITLLTEAEVRAGSVAVVTGGEINALAGAEVRAGAAAAGAATELGALGAAEARAGAAGAGAAGGIGAAGASAGAATLRFGVLAAGALALVNNLHAATSAGGKAKQTVDGLMTVQDTSRVSDYQQRVSNLEGELHKVTGVGAFFKGVIGSIGFGKSGQQMITEANQIRGALATAKQQADNAKTATDQLSGAYHLNYVQVQDLAAKYHIDLGGSIVATESRFAALSGQMGLTTTVTDSTGRHVQTLTHDINGIPRSASTAVSTPGLPQALQDLAHLDGSISRVDGRVIHITSVVDQADVNVVGPGTSRRAAGGLVGFAGGGVIHGPGTGTSDSILGLAAGGTPTAWVSNGEYVVNAAQTAKNLPLLEAINAGKGGSGSGSGLDAGYGKLTTDTTTLSTKAQELTKHLADQTKVVKDQAATVTDGHTKLLAFTDATTAHRTAVDALIPRVVASTQVHTADHRTVDGLTGGYHTLTGAIQQTPTAHHTNTDAPGAVTSTNQIRTLESTIRSMQPKTDRINIDTSVSGVFASLFANGGLVGLAGGGMLRGPGTGTSDSILGVDPFSGMPTAFVSNGEFVVNAADTARTLPLLQAINAGMFANGGLIKKLAAGGAVTSRVSDPTSSNGGQFIGGASRLADRVDSLLHPRAQKLIGDKAAEDVKQKISAMTAGVGGGVGRWAPLVLTADKMLGLSPSNLGTVLSQMATESGGNPSAINLWDSNAAAGHPSKGLMQVIDPTFNAYAGPLRGLGVWNPLANIYAGLNYAKSRYGAGLGALGHGHGYAAGGLVGGGARPVPASARQFLTGLYNDAQQLKNQDTWAGGLSRVLDNGGVTAKNVTAYDAWVGDTVGVERKYAAMQVQTQKVLAAHPYDANLQRLAALANSWEQQAQTAVAKAQSMQAQARARIGSPEAINRIMSPTSAGSSWAALHAPVTGPTHAVVPISVQIDGREIFKAVQTQALRNENRNGSNNLSKSR